MAYTAVNNLIKNIKLRVDYNVVDFDLDNLILDVINDRLKGLAELMLANGINDEMYASTTLTTVVGQPYIDLSGKNIDEIIKLSERVNDTPIEIIEYEDFVDIYTDPTAYSANTPDQAALFGNRLYLGPTPSAVITLYCDYEKDITNLNLGDSLPFSDEYDPWMKAAAKLDLTNWLDKSNAVAIASAQKELLYWTETLITDSAKNIGKNQQTGSRRPSIPFGPRKAI